MNLTTIRLIENGECASARQECAIVIRCTREPLVRRYNAVREGIAVMRCVLAMAMHRIKRCKRSPRGLYGHSMCASRKYISVMQRGCRDHGVSAHVVRELGSCCVRASRLCVVIIRGTRVLRALVLRVRIDLSRILCAHSVGDHI